MTALFTSYACDWCDGLKRVDACARGWVLWRGQEGLEHYVFAMPEDAERYRDAVGLVDHEIREVLSEEAFVWHASRGSVRDVVLARHRYTVWPDERFPIGEHRAWLAHAHAARPALTSP
jgi:hypothetical protein